MFLNTPIKIKKNISNTLSQYYSKQKVRDLLYNESTKENINYDMVIISRFDMLKEIDINLNDLDKNYTYISNIHYPRFIFSDDFVISPYNIFLKFLNVYDNLHNLINNDELREKITQYKEEYIMCSETLLFSNYLYYYNDLSNIKYINIPHFI
jgi:hypothetical protein